MIFALAVCLAAHEAAHYAAARGLGLNARFAPRRGFAVAYWREDAPAGSRLPPRERLLVSLAGPLANLAMAAVWRAALVPGALLFAACLLPLQGSDGRYAWRALRELR